MVTSIVTKTVLGLSEVSNRYGLERLERLVYGLVFGGGSPSELEGTTDSTSAMKALIPYKVWIFGREQR